MAHIPDLIKEEIKRRIHLPELVQATGVRLQRSGNGWRSKCPFEPESRNPTKFRVSQDRYKCYACGRQGDVFTWLREYEGLEFRDALKRAAEMVGIDLRAYERRDPGVDEAEKRRQALRSVLSDLAQLSYNHALQLPLEARRWNEMDLTPLIRSGEVGLLPEPEEIKRILRERGHSASALRGTGIRAALDGLGNRWVLWGQWRGQLNAVRPLGADGPVAGMGGERSRGWVRGGEAFCELSGSRIPLIASNDEVYIALRVAGVSGAYRPVSTSTLEAAARLDVLRDTGRPPLLLAFSEPSSRRQALMDALRLLTGNPRLRVAELPPVQDWLRDAESAIGVVRRAEAKAGMVIDWQVELFVRHGGLVDPEDRALAVRRLSRIISAMPEGPEREACRAEVEWLTGLPVPEVIRGSQVQMAGGVAMDSCDRRQSRTAVPG